MKKRLSPFMSFIRQYKQFCAVTLISIAGLGLQLAGYGSIARWVISLTALAISVPLLLRMIQDLRSGTYGVDILAITAIVTAVIMGEYWAAIVIVLMLTGGEALEDYAENRARREMTALLDNAPRRARLIRGKKEQDVAASKIVKGDKILIRPGELVPVDAVILEGTSSFDESSLTGESVPEERTTGAEILSGSINIASPVLAKALRPAVESQYEQIVRLVKQAAASKAPFVRMADRFAIPFTVIAFGLAIGAWLISGDSLRFLQVMVVATPCPLILAAPIAIISGMSRASKAGIIVKNGTALERLASAKAVAFDKTGTLTHGRLKVTKVVAVKGQEVAEVLTLLAALGKGSNHITSLAAVEEADRRGLALPNVKNMREEAGKGMSATVKTKPVIVGRSSYLEAAGVEIPAEIKNRTDAETSTLVAASGKLVGYVLYGDEIRDDAASTIARLRARGIEEIRLITGDVQAIAEKVGKAVGIKKEHITAKALPVDKLRTVEQSKVHPIAFVGDGVNDAPVLVASDVGIALGAKGSSAASESADIVIMKDEISDVAVAHGIARRTFMIARQSILIGIGLSVILMLVFATGKFSPVIGAAVQEVVDLVVIVNALRAHVAGHRGNG